MGTALPVGAIALLDTPPNLLRLRVTGLVEIGNAEASGWAFRVLSIARSVGTEL